MKVINGRVRDDKGRPFPWRSRAHLDRIDGSDGPPAWVCVYPAYSGFVFLDGSDDGGHQVQIIGPLHPGRAEIVESYRLRGALADVKHKVREALDRRQLAFLAHDRPLSRGGTNATA